MTDTATLNLSYGHVEVEFAVDGGVTLYTYGPRGGYNASLETAFPEPLVALLEQVVTAAGERGLIQDIYTQALPNTDRRLVARPGMNGAGSAQLHTSRPELRNWHRDTVGARLVELPVRDLPAVIALLRERLPKPPSLRLV